MRTGQRLSSDIGEIESAGYLLRRHVARILGLSPGTVCDLVKAGRVKRVRSPLARSYVYDYDSVMSELARRKARAAMKTSNPTDEDDILAKQLVDSVVKNAREAERKAILEYMKHCESQWMDDSSASASADMREAIVAGKHIQNIRVVK